MKDDVKTEHESWCLVQANRVSGRSDDLFATSIDHQHTIQLRIARAAEYRSHGYGHYLDREELIRVEMSPMQWAELMTSMNCGSGVPCTLRRFEGKMVNGKRHESEAARIQDEVSERAKEIGANIYPLIDQVRERLAKTSLSKKAQDEVMELVGKLAGGVHGYLPFMHKLFTEACEGTVTEAKAAVDAFVTHSVMAAGLEYLGESVQKRLGVRGGSDDIPDSLAE